MTQAREYAMSTTVRQPSVKMKSSTSKYAAGGRPLLLASVGGFLHSPASPRRAGESARLQKASLPQGLAAALARRSAEKAAPDNNKPGLDAFIFKVQHQSCVMSCAWERPWHLL